MGLGKLVAKLTKKGAKDGSSKVIEADTHEVDSAPVVLGPTEAEPIDRKILESADNITANSEPRLVLGPQLNKPHPRPSLILNLFLGQTKSLRLRLSMIVTLGTPRLHLSAVIFGIKLTTVSKMMKNRRAW
jgi:hypothetical protein